VETQVIEKFEILKRTLKEKFAAKGIYVFGSHAFGEPGQDSDLDICIITDLGDKRKIDVIRDIRRELTRFLTDPLDILVYSAEEFRERAAHKNTLEHKILMEGIRLDG
jgi:predicted nucleotidyltransferase